MRCTVMCFLVVYVSAAVAPRHVCAVRIAANRFYRHRNYCLRLSPKRLRAHLRHMRAHTNTHGVLCAQTHIFFFIFFCSIFCAVISYQVEIDICSTSVLDQR